MRDFRSDLENTWPVLVSAPGGQRQIPIGQLANIKVTRGPSMIRNEDGLLTGYVMWTWPDGTQAAYIEDAGNLILGQG